MTTMTNSDDVSARAIQDFVTKQIRLPKTAKRLADEMLWAKLYGFLSGALDRLEAALVDEPGNTAMLNIRADLRAWLRMTREAARMKPPNASDHRPGL